MSVDLGPLQGVIVSTLNTSSLRPLYTASQVRELDRRTIAGGDRQLCLDAASGLQRVAQFSLALAPGAQRDRAVWRRSQRR